MLHNEVEHNYISSSITLGLQLHVSALYVGHLQDDLTFGAAIQDVWGVLLGYWGVGLGERDLVVTLVRTVTYSYM